MRCRDCGQLLSAGGHAHVCPAPRAVTVDEVHKYMKQWRELHPKIVVLWESSARAMVLADLVEPWVWAYHGHVLPNGSVVYFPHETAPKWRSNSTEWHGL